MIEATGNLWQYHSDGEVICITTNGMVNSQGDLIMGAGIALTAKDKYPLLPRLLGMHVNEHGNIPLFVPLLKIISYPTKYDWRYKSSLKLIKNSAYLIKKIADKYSLERVYLPPPGCGHGKLSWTDVKPIIDPIFDDDRFIVLIN